MELITRTLNITPDKPVSMGAGPAGGTSTGVSQPLEANIAILRQGADTLAFVTLDLLYPGAALRRAVEEGLSNIDPSCIMVGASHTHYAPCTFDGKPGLGKLESDYVRRLADKLRRTLQEMIDTGGRDVQEWRIGLAGLDHSINRRRITRHGVRMAPNAEGSRDENATIIIAELDGRPGVALWNYACHPVSYPVRQQVASHFPHDVRVALRRRLQAPDLPVLFFQGFSGDTRPSAATKLRLRPRDIARRLKWGKSFYDMSASGYRHWAKTLAANVAEAAASASTVSVTGLNGQQVNRKLSDFVVGGRDGQQVNFRMAELHPHIRLIGASAEIVSEYAPWLRGLSDEARHIICVGCLDDTFGYLPTEAMLRQGGYEAGGYCRQFSYTELRTDAPANARRAFEELIISKRKISNEAYI